MMKKMIMALCIFICAFTLVACSGQQTNEPLTLGVNAIITEIDKENKAIFAKDNGEESILGDDCLIDCSKIPMIYCNYETQTIFYKGIMPSEKILDFPVDCNFLTGSVNL